MKPTAVIILAAAFAGLSGASAFADCVDTTSSIGNQARTGIAKDGTHAPLEAQNKGGTGAAVNTHPANKTGNTMPLASNQGGGDKNLATSQQDVNAQQHGGKTAAAAATRNRGDCKG
jgi:hypothetical protein